MLPETKAGPMVSGIKYLIVNQQSAVAPGKDTHVRKLLKLNGSW
jgi:hypothetical protein